MNGEYRDFVNKIKDMDLTDWQTEIVEEYISIGDHPVYGGKHSGSDAEHKGSKYIAEKMKELGLDNVELVPVKTDRFQFNDAALTSEDGRIVIRPYATTTIGTDAEGIDAIIVDAGAGSVEDFDKDDVNGKIVLLTIQVDIVDTCPLINESINEAAKRGAVAVVVSNDDEVLEEDTITALPNYRKVNIPVVSVSRNDAAAIRSYKGKWHLDVDAEFIPRGGITYGVVGEIKGSSSDERIVYTGHLDHYFKCIQDNVSSVVSILAIIKMIKDTGYVPKHTMTFLINGAHEIGNVESDSGDFKGIYGLMHEARPDILEKSIADINFEYTALEEHDLRVVPSHSVAGTYLRFAEEMPDKLPGFDKVANDVRSEDFYGTAWCDAAIFTMSGIPVFVNDCMADQIYTMDSPYMGRDHSQKDNWDVYSRDALKTNTFWYAALGAYLDNKALMEIDFSYWMDAVDFEEEEKEFAAAAGLDLSEFSEAMNDVKKQAEKLNSAIAEYNSVHNVDAGSVALNREILKINRLVSGSVDRTTSQIIKVIGPLYKFYGMNLVMMLEAAELLQNGKVDEAKAKLLGVDITAVSYRFGKEAGDTVREYVEGKNATWTAGKSGVCFDLSGIMHEEADVMLEKLYEEIERMTALLAENIEEVAACFKEAAVMIAACAEKIRK